MSRIDRAYRLMCVRVGISKFKGQADAYLSQPEKLVALLSQYSKAYIKPNQRDAELAELIRDVSNLKPRTVLEIGTAGGGTLFLWTRLARKDATIVSVDLPGGKFGGGYSKIRASLYRHFAEKSQKLHLLRENSHATETFEKVRMLFNGGGIDLLFIDGDHTYEGVKADWEMYSQLVRPGGMVVFHDVAGNYADTQVKRLWDSIKPGFEHRELIEGQDGKYGIGILRLAAGQAL